MNYINLDSVGTAIDTDGMTHPIFADGTIDNDEGMGVHILDTTEEWRMNLSKDEAFEVLEFCEKNGVIDMGFFPEGENTKWASDMYHISGTIDNMMEHLLSGGSI